MLEVEQLTYSAIITINLPGSDRPATASITLMPQDAIPTGSGQVKLLRDCTLADLNEFAEALEAEVWAAYQERLLTDLAGDEEAHVKITILNETGQPLSLAAEEWLAHAVIFPDQAGEPVEIIPPAETAEMPAEPALDLTEDEEEDASSSGEIDVLETADVDFSDVEQPCSEDEEETAISESVADQVEEPADALATETEAQEIVAEKPEPEVVAPPIAAPAEELPPVEEVPPEEEPLLEPAEKPEIRIAGLRRPLGHPTPAAVDILINEPVFRDAQAHALSSMDREVAGVLVGPMPEKQPDGRYVVHITDIIIAKHTKMHGASVTYTPESWRHIHDRLAERYPHEEALIVGWYHTHPGFGIFLSGMDLFIHQNFFTQIWHIALVLDPVARRSGFFCWNRGQTEVKQYDFPWPRWLAGSW